MDVVFKFCAGLDVHKKIIVACVLLSSPEGCQRHIQTISTMLVGLEVFGGLVVWFRRHPRGDGKYGGALETSVQCALRPI